ncbi:hypothetical protein BH11PSE9_BH11PSE9_25140 [soil metagenome]
MGLGTRRQTRVAIGLLVVLGLAATFDGTRLLQTMRWNDIITAGSVPAGSMELSKEQSAELPRQVLFARAYAHSQETSSGQGAAQVAAIASSASAAASASAVGSAKPASAAVPTPSAPAGVATPPAPAASSAEEAALHGYRSLQDDSPLGQAARYNSANLLMRQAVIVRASTQPGQAITLVELAKEMYRDVLRVDPQHWAARYNLERAQRLVAEPEEAEAGPVGPERNAERAATTMRGYSPGLP